MKRTAALITALVMILLLCLPAGAQTISTELPCTLQLNYHDENDEKLTDLSVSLYRVADLNADGEAEPTSEFSGYGIDADALNERTDTAVKLSEYVQRDSITPDYTGKTDQDGKLGFTDLPTGVYLIVSDSVTDGKTVLRTQPLLLDLPMIDEKTGVYAYDVTASPKPERTKILREMNLLVIWRNDTAEQRPKSVTIELYRDGELYDTQIVSGDNGWKYSWKDVGDSGLSEGGSGNLSDDYADATAQAKDHLITGEHSWYVIERGADGYTVTYAVRPVNNTFIVINTLKSIATPDQPLPQTGQLWWPVPLFAATGILTLILSHRVGRKRHE